MRIEYTEEQELWLRRTEIESVLENELFAVTEEDIENGMETEAALLTELDAIEERLDGMTLEKVWR